MVETTVQLRGDIAGKAKRNANQGVKEAYEELKEMYGRRDIISAVIHVDETTPIYDVILLPIDQAENLSAKDVIGDKRKCAGRREIS